MLLEWIAKLGFIQKDTTSSVYADFPVQTRRLIASHTAAHLLKETTDAAILSSATHIHVIMESIGQGFGLPLEESETIENITELYRRWLLNPKRPPPIEADEQPFFRKIFLHFSLLFEPRGSQVDVQVQLCSRVLGILEQAGREIGSKFTTETWELLLRVMLGIVDVLLKDPTDEPAQLSSKLCPQLLKVLFQLWYRSQTFNDSLWKSFAQLMNGWRHRLPTINQYNAVTAAFTAKVLRLLYGNNEGADMVTVTESDGTKTTYDLNNEFIYYAWYRSLHLLGDMETMTLPNNYLEAMRGLNNIVDMFLTVGTKRDPNAPKPPDGNTILHIVGPFLFESINIHEQAAAFDRGKSQAFTTLAKIFSVKAPFTEFDNTYLSCFYRGIEQCLKKNNYMMGIVLNNCLSLFQCEFKGVRTLIPAFLAAMEAVLTSGKPLEGISSKIQVLRLSCIKILQSLLGLPHHFDNLKFKEKEVNPEPNRLKSYTELRSKLSSLLLEGIRTEEDSANRQLLLWTASLFIYENIEFQDFKDFPHLLITLLLSKVVANAWPTEDILQTLNILSELSVLYSFVSEYNQETGGYIVSTLARYIESLMEEKKGAQLQEAIIVKSYYTILDWIMCDTKFQWIVTNNSCLKLVFEVVEIGITGARYTPSMGGQETPVNKRRTLLMNPDSSKDEDKRKSTVPKKNYLQPTDRIKEAANCILTNILYHVDSFPTPLGPSRISTLVNEKDVLEANKLTSNHVTCFAYDHTLITVIRHSREKGTKIRATIILRDESGKYAWDTELNYTPTPYTQPADDDKLNKEEKKKHPIEEVDETLLGTLSGFLSDQERRIHDKVLKLTDLVVNNQNKVLTTKKFGLNVDVALKRPTAQVADDSVDPTSARLFLSHLGITSVDMFEDLIPLQKFNDPDHKFNYLQNFTVLDKTKERDTYQIGVLYFDKSQSDVEVFENQGGSPAYQKFIKNLGWLVDINSHTGFTGGLDPKVTGSVAPYFANYDHEVIFQVGTLMPNKESNTRQMHKTRLIMNNRVLISWVEDIGNYKIPIESGANINIVIHPLPSGLYQIKVLTRVTPEQQQQSPNFEVPLVGPAVDNAIVSPHVLPLIVRQTSLNAARALKEDKTKQFTVRRFLIEDFILRNRVELPFHQYLAAQFSPY